MNEPWRRLDVHKKTPGWKWKQNLVEIKGMDKYGQSEDQ